MLLLREHALRYQYFYYSINAVVFTDIPDNSVVVLNKPRVIAKTNMDNRFYQHHNGKYGYWQDGKHHPIDS